MTEFTMEQHLSSATAEVLRDLGRNESADPAIRKACVSKLIEKNHPYASHPDFRELRIQLKEEQEAHAEVESLIAQVEPVVEKVVTSFPVQKTDVEKAVFTNSVEVKPQTVQIKTEPKEENPGPLKASFTTKNL